MGVSGWVGSRGGGGLGGGEDQGVVGVIGNQGSGGGLGGGGIQGVMGLAGGGGLGLVGSRW